MTVGDKVWLGWAYADEDDELRVVCEEAVVVEVDHLRNVKVAYPGGRQRRVSPRVVFPTRAAAARAVAADLHGMADDLQWRADDLRAHAREWDAKANADSAGG